ncbi:hypothetical protein IM538_13195 [Cytobacillus suaedae]|nr:hypothetical protein IM538_13195 [Cytobacillus suaedae]
MKKFSLTLLLIFFSIGSLGCQQSAKEEASPPGTPNTSQEHAEEIAKTVYNLEIQDIVLRDLQTDELDKRPDDAKLYTPVYYVITGKNGDKNDAIVYVSSNNPEHHFIDYKKD